MELTSNVIGLLVDLPITMTVVCYKFFTLPNLSCEISSVNELILCIACLQRIYCHCRDDARRSDHGRPRYFRHGLSSFISNASAKVPDAKTSTSRRSCFEHTCILGLSTFSCYHSTWTGSPTSHVFKVCSKKHVTCGEA